MRLGAHTLEDSSVCEGSRGTYTNEYPRAHTQEYLRAFDSQSQVRGVRRSITGINQAVGGAANPLNTDLITDNTYVGTETNVP